MSDSYINRGIERKIEQQDSKEKQSSSRRFPLKDTTPSTSVKEEEKRINILKEYFKNRDEKYSEEVKLHTKGLQALYQQTLRGASYWKALIDNKVLQGTAAKEYGKCADELERILKNYQEEAEKFHAARRKDAIAKRADDIMRESNLSHLSSFSHLQPEEELDLSSCIKEGVFTPRLGFSFQQHTEESQPTSASEGLRERFWEAYLAVYNHSGEFYRKETSDNILVPFAKAHQVAFALTYSQACTHAFQERVASFTQQEIEQAKRELAQKRRLLEKEIGFPDMTEFLKKSDIFSEEKRKKIMDAYESIESQGNDSSRLKKLGELAEELVPEWRVYEFTGMAIKHLPKRISSIQEMAQKRMKSIADELGWEKFMERVTEVLTNERIDERVRSGIARAVGHIGNEVVADKLVDMLENEQINLHVRSEIAGAVGHIGNEAVADRLVNMLENEQINPYMHPGIKNAHGLIKRRRS